MKQHTCSRMARIHSQSTNQARLSTTSTHGRYLGPGGQDVLSTPDGDLIFFHGWNELFMYRGMHSAPLEWDGDVPSVRLP